MQTAVGDHCSGMSGAGLMKVPFLRKAWSLGRNDLYTMPMYAFSFKNFTNKLLHNLKACTKRLTNTNKKKTLKNGSFCDEVIIVT